MPDLAALHTALSGLRAARTAIDTSAHNVANAATPGYRRQRVDLATRPATQSTVGWVGSGVDVVDISRARDAFLDARYRVESGAAHLLETRSGLLEKAEAILDEPEGGISRELDELWASFETWALDPSDSAARLDVLARLESLASRVASTDHAWTMLGDDVTSTLHASTEEVNGLLSQVADLNRVIAEASASGGSPNDLLDERDRVLDRLAEVAGATTTIGTDGSARVSIGGIGLVSGTSARAVSFDVATGQVLDPSGNVVPVGGELGGAVAFLSEDLPAARGRLDDWVEELAAQINGQHQAGYWSGGAGGALLGYDPTAPAATLEVLIADPTRLAAADDPGPPFPVHDGANAQALADLRTDPFGGGPRLGDELRAMVTELAQNTASTRRAAAAQTDLAAATDLARTNALGVSIDEEMVLMLESQRTYEAAARVITAVDEALEVLIQRTGLVGR